MPEKNMSKDKIIQYILMDVRREEDDVISFLDSRSKYDNMTPKEKIDLYRRLQTNRPDAERRQRAMESYLNYPAIKDKYSVRGDFLCYNESILITADLLTGTKGIISRANKFKEEESKVLRAFYTVAYTIGNCCPVMKNKGGRTGKAGGGDTCWYKLSKFIDVNQTYSSITNLPEQEKKDLRSRGADNMFMIFDKDMTGIELVENLLFQDYYGKSNGTITLIENRNLNKIETSKDYLEYIEMCTKLIVQRGMRICMGYTEKEFEKDQEEILFDIFRQIGLPCDSDDKYTLV
jgi:hypothetical protein